jgi:hypothetical protein
MLVRAASFESVPHDPDVLTYRAAAIGPMSIGEIAFRREFRLECDDAGHGFLLHLPIADRYYSRYRGIDTVVSPVSTTVYRPGGGPFASSCPPGFRALSVRFAPAAVAAALGTLMAHWAVDMAARAGAQWVRRDCAFPELAKYYQSQGYDLVREADRKGHRLFMMARKAERLDLAAVFHR